MEYRIELTEKEYKAIMFYLRAKRGKIMKRLGVKPVPKDNGNLQTITITYDGDTKGVIKLYEQLI